MACGKCNKKKCGCKDAPLSTVYACGQNADLCPTPDICTEYSYINCSVYTGQTIQCQGGVIAEEGDRLNVIIQRMVQVFCAAQECCTAEETPFDNEDLPIKATNVQDAIEQVIGLITPNTEYTLQDNGDGTFSLVDNSATVVSTVSKSSLTDNNDGTYTFDNGDGNPITFNVINCCSASDTSYNNTVSGLSASDVQGAIDEIAAGMGQGHTYTLEDNNDGTFSLIEDGTTTISTINKAYLVDNGDNTYTFDNGDGNPIILDLNCCDAIDIAYDNSNSGLSSTNVNDAIDEVVGIIPTPNTYKLVDNGDGTFSLEENGTIVVPNISKGSLVDNGNGTYTYDNGNGAPVTFNVGGGATLFYSVTKAQLDAHVANGTLVEGATYWITDRGDVGLFFKAVSTNWLDFENGYRIMRVPIDYNVISVGANTMHGIWQNTLSVVAGDYVIWGGKVWENLNGNIGAENDQFTLDAEWQLVPKTDNNVYKNFGLGCIYDYSNDWIAYCWDNRGNRLGISYQLAQAYGFPETATNFSDWNSSQSIFDNQVFYICNNTNIGVVYNNSNNGGVYNNSNNGEVYNNSNRGGVYRNSNDGDVNNNSNNGTIDNNNNQGAIENNSNKGVISGNMPNVTDIINNSNNGTIDNNNNQGAIENNANNGFISANENQSSISGNRNNGNILGNTGNVKLIRGNINNGDINNNDNSGDINKNSNNGAIVNANSSVLSIEFNINNGIIDGTSLSGVITDTIVDKV